MIRKLTFAVILLALLLGVTGAGWASIITLQ